MKLSAPEKKISAWSARLMILATVLLTCAPVLASNYGYADDFWLLSMRPLDADTVMKAIHGFIDEGRCLFPVWALGVIGQAQDIQDLRWVRLIAEIPSRDAFYIDLRALRSAP